MAGFVLLFNGLGAAFMTPTIMGLYSDVKSIANKQGVEIEVKKDVVECEPKDGI